MVLCRHQEASDTYIHVYSITAVVQRYNMQVMPTGAVLGAALSGASPPPGALQTTGGMYSDVEDGVDDGVKGSEVGAGAWLGSTQG